MSETKENEELLVDHEYNGKQLKIYPEVAEFFRQKKDAERLMYLAYAKADAEYNKIKDEAYLAHLEGGGDPHTWSEGRDGREARQAKMDARRVAENAYYDAIEPGRMDPQRRRDPENPNVWADLKSKTNHKIVTWMLENTLRSQAHETEIMLHYLPASPDELWSYAKDDHDFCNVFDTFMGQAEAAGLFSDADMASMAGLKEFRALQSYMRRELYSTTTSEITRRVGKIMSLIREDADKRLAEAKAEWQGLDEAWRSERSRRGAATRAANQAAEQEETSEAIARQGEAEQAERVRALAEKEEFAVLDAFETSDRDLVEVDF